MAQDYRELATTLRGRIDAGEFRQTGKLPTEDQLIEEYQTTRYRVRNAIAVLAEAGDVFPVRGSGVFVREDREGDYLSIGTTRGISGGVPASQGDVRGAGVVAAAGRLRAGQAHALRRG